MKILIVDTYYDKYLKIFYKKNPNLKNCEYDFQIKSLLNSNFGTSDTYSYYLNKNNWEASDLIVNCLILQKKWAENKDIKLSKLRSMIPHKFLKLPIIGKKLGNMNGLLDIAKEQIKAYKPEILYCQDLSFFPEEILLEIKKENNIRLIVGQIACPLPPKSFLNPYDLILTSFPHFVNRLRNDGKNWL